MTTVHFAKPSRRTGIEAKSAYGKYRKELREDFHQSCGYCDDSDLRTDRIAFHIDHFAPKKQFPELERLYDNLVYACRYCNIPKSNHWVGDDANQPNDGSEGFVDPCNAEYDAHLGREPSGRIFGKTDLGRYIVKRLKLGLLRHELLWQARQARSLRAEIEPLLVRYREADLPKGPKYIELLERFEELTKKFENYELSANNQP